MARLLRLGVSGFSPLGPLETRVMNVLWSRYPAQLTVGDVEDSLGDSAPSYSAIKAVLANVVTKRLAEKIDTGRAKSYQATCLREEFEQRLISEVVDPIFRTHRNPLLAHLVDQLLDDEALAEVEALIALRRAAKQ